MPILHWINDTAARSNGEDIPLHVIETVKHYGDATADNLLVHGDNLLALRALLPFYQGQVKCIYIDPPYNTGSAFEHYDDNLEHSQWLSLIYPRLQLLRDFLTEDGSIWVSIDDRESHYLKVIMDEIFGRNAFIGDVSWQRTYSTRNDSKGLCVEVEHILAYGKTPGWTPGRLPRTAEMDAKYKNPDNDFAPWKNSDAFAPGAATHQGMVYAVQSPFTGKLIYPSINRCWCYGQDEVLKIMQGWGNYHLVDIHDSEERARICGVTIDKVRSDVKAIVLADDLTTAKNQAEVVLANGHWPVFYFTKNGLGGISRKIYLTNVEGRLPTNFWPYEEVGHTDEAKKEIRKLFDHDVFATPKPERLIERVLTIATHPGDLVLDSFLGSGTTAAVAHKMGRRWIGIELGEHAKTHCLPRLEKVIAGEQGGISEAVKWQGGGGFTYCELGASLLDELGLINPAVDFKTLAAHIWLTEMKTPIRPDDKPLVGIQDQTALYVLFGAPAGDPKKNGVVLTRNVLKKLLQDYPHDGDKIIYADAMVGIAETELKKDHILFKQIPHDIRG